jgi:tetratricopeptide (TPR) repeat protein
MNLSRLPQLRVMAWSTVARYRGRDLDVVGIGRELGVRSVFAGRLIQRGDRLLIRTELVSTDDGAQLWGEQYRRQMDDLLTIEQEISGEICERLRLRLNEEERQRLARRHTDNAEAYHLYLKGRFHWNQRSARGLRKAIECFEAAIRLDTAYAMAYAGLADCYCLTGIYGGAPPQAVMPRAKEAALKALAIDEGLAEAHTSLAAALVWYDWDWEGSEREFRRAIELNPAYSVAHHWYGSVLLSALGRHDEALAAERRALEIEPLSLVINSNLGFIRYQAGCFDEAVEYQRKAIEMDDGFVYAHFNLGLSLAQLGRFDEAIQSLERAIALVGGRGALITAALGYVCARAGRREAARDILAQLQTYPAHRDVSPFFLAMVYAGLEDTERTLAALEAACDERYNWIVWLRTEPIFAPLRAQARYRALLERVGLKP